MALHYTGVRASVPRLSPEQLTAIAAVEWLLDPDDRRAQGRTTALAIATIRVAAAYPGRAIPVHDHHPARESSRALAIDIQRFVQADPLLSPTCRWRRLIFFQGRTPELFFELTTPIRNWMPANWQMPDTPPRRPARIVETVPLSPFRHRMDRHFNETLANLNSAILPAFDPDHMSEPTDEVFDRPSNDQLQAIMYACDAARATPQRRERSLWDYLEEDDEI